MQFYYWLSTVSEYHWSSTRVPLLQYYCESTVLGLVRCQHYSTTKYCNSADILRHSNIPTTVLQHTHCRE
eukprot:9097203-Pyramimonas_sp.AAC.1